MIKREEIEWTDTWWAQADDRTTPRVLLVGDSITRAYHPHVQGLFGQSIRVDRFATSKFATDPFFVKEIALYFAEYPYRCIHLNHGLHGLDFPDATYAQGLECLIQAALMHCSRVILATSTPVMCTDDLTQPDEKNAIVCSRNAIVRTMSEKYALPLNDLYAVIAMSSSLHMRNVLHSADGVHYTDEGDSALATQVHTALLPLLQ